MYSPSVYYPIAGNFCQEKTPILPPVLISEIYFLSYVNDYIDDMATFTVLEKNYSTKYFCNEKVAGPGEMFVQQKFSFLLQAYRM